MTEDYYRIFWTPFKTSKRNESPFVFTHHQGQKTIRNMQKLCKKTIFELKKEDHPIPNEIRNNFSGSFEDLILKIHYIELKKMDRLNQS